jgi:hypothetical protein
MNIDSLYSLQDVIHDRVVVCSVMCRVSKDVQGQNPSL